MYGVIVSVMISDPRGIKNRMLFLCKIIFIVKKEHLIFLLYEAMKLSIVKKTQFPDGYLKEKE